MNIKDVTQQSKTRASTAFIAESIRRLNSEELAKKILNQAGVALTPGTDFDKKFGQRTMRLAFSIDNQTVIEAVTKLKKWFMRNY